MGNRTDKKGYLGLILVLGVITVCAFFKIMPKYQLKLFETKISASVFFITLSLFSVIGGLVISVKKERNLKSALIIWLLPCLIYLGGFYWKSLTFWYITLFLIIAGSLLMTRISREIARSSMSDNDSYVVLGKRSRYIVVRAIICFALAAGVLLGTFIEKEKIIPQNTNTKQDYQAKKKANDQSKYLLFFDNWQNTTSEQKKQAVMALIDLETKALGINGNYQINITSLADGEKAKYREEKGKTYIQINESIYNATDGYKIINVICFGMYYDYQNVQVNFFKELCDNKKLQKYKGLPLFKKSELYSNKEKGVTYRKKDCVAYAATREKHYQKSIKQYKEENK